MLVLLGADTPVPTPTSTVDPNLVTPGFAGFVVVVFVVIAVFLLIWDMNRRVRRVRYREEVREELDAEQAAADAETSGVEIDDATGTGPAHAADPSDGENPRA